MNAGNTDTGRVERAEAIARSLQSDYGHTAERAMLLARRSLGLAPLVVTVTPAGEPESQEPQAERVLDPSELGKLEKAIEHAGDTLMLALGWRVVRFSQARESKQTPGIPDRKYYDPRRSFTFWWEAKSPAGRQRPDQSDFQRMAEACGEVYVLGGLGDLKTFLATHGVVAGFEPDGTPIPLSLIPLH